MKTCNNCGLEKPTTEFFKSSNTKTGLQGECKTCNSTRAKSWYKNNKNRTRDKKLIRAYGISLIEYETLIKSQNGFCAVCKTDLKKDKHTCVDHCHKTNLVRGVLCTNCNILLGHAKDNIQTLENAIQYLKRHS